MSFVPSFPRLSHKLPPSSKNWLARQFKDPLVRERLSHPANYRARSAFKLLDLDREYKIFKYNDVNAVVDLGAAPGGWSQVVAGKLGWTMEDVVGSRNLARKEVDGSSSSEELDVGFGLKDNLKSKSHGTWSAPLSSTEQNPSSEADAPPPKGRGTIVAVDLLPIWPIPGVKTLQMDFLSSQADQYINALLSFRPGVLGKADVILSDMAANFTGNRIRDTESSLQICEAVLEFTKRHMRTAEEIGRARGGVLVLKHFAHPLLQQFRQEQLEPFFRKVIYSKPDSSRSESSEGYWVCFGFLGNQT